MINTSGSFSESTWRAYELNKRLAQEEDDLAFEKAVERYGKYLGEHPEHGKVFERGYGEPCMSPTEDEYGRVDGYTLEGVTSSRIHTTKSGRVLVISGNYFVSWVPTEELNPYWVKATDSNKSTFGIPKYVHKEKVTFKPKPKGLFFILKESLNGH